MTASHRSVALNYFRTGLRILFRKFLETKTQLWKLMWAFLGCCIGSSGSPLHAPAYNQNTKIPVLNLTIIWKIMCKFEFHCWKLGKFKENKTGHILDLMDQISKVFFTENE